MFKTHLLFSLFLALLIFNYFNLNPYLFVIILVFSAILPDIDHGKSWIGRKLKLFSFIINLIFKHRRFIHSIIFASIAALIIRIFLGLYWIPFYIGYLSHLVLDAFTKQGVYLFYPSNFRIKGWVKVNGLTERAFLVFLGIINIIYIVKYIL